MEKIFLDAIQQWGCINQTDMATEECAELIQAINKVKRTFHPAQIKYFQQLNTLENKQMPKFESQKEAEVYHAICSEIADVKIMMAQLEIIFNKETIDLNFDRKVARLQERLIKKQN